MGEAAPQETAAPQDLADRDLLIDAATAAAPLALSAFRAGKPTAARRWRKDDGSVLTQVDLAVNARLREILRAARPDYGWLSEEDVDAPDRGEADRVFIIDPIDGTRSFAEGKRDFCLSLAVAAAGRVVAAAILAPARETLYAAAEGASATRNGAPMTAPEGPTAPEEAGALIVKRDLKPVHWIDDQPPIFREVMYLHPLALRFCRVAEGAADALVVLKQTHEWDIAAGDLIARAAGRAVTDPSGAPLRFNTAERRVTGALAAGPALHAALRARLRAA